MDNTLLYLDKLIGFPSITPLSAGSIEFIYDILVSHGFRAEIKTFGSPPVTNLYAEYGSASPNICFAGHIDVVAPGDISLWKNAPFKATIYKERIYGRGAVDMKGAIAASLSAVIKYIKNNKFNGQISFLITIDEEGEAKFGTREMLKYITKQGKKIDFAIIGEPTTDKKIGDTIKIGRRGSIDFTLKLIGKQGHVAYPDSANNPITSLITALHAIKNFELDKGTEFFQKSNLEITSLDAVNTTTNMIPSNASATFNIRFNDLYNASTLIELIHNILKPLKLEYELTSRSGAEAFIQQPKEYIKLFEKIVSDVTKETPKLSTSGGTSDARFIQNYCHVVEFGLPFHSAHKIDEYLEISDLQTLYDVYYETLYKFLG